MLHLHLIPKPIQNLVLNQTHRAQRSTFRFCAGTTEQEHYPYKDNMNSTAKIDSWQEPKSPVAGTGVDNDF